MPQLCSKILKYSQNRYLSNTLIGQVTMSSITDLCSKTKTIFQPQVIDPDLATGIFHSLKEGIQWEEGIRSRKGFTRKAKAIQLEDYPELNSLVLNVLANMTDRQYLMLGAYLNYYEDGVMYTPNHSHQGTSQLIISLGATRTLTLGKKNYPMNSGDAILFGSTVHGVPREPLVTEGRISIATFMKAL